MGLNLTSLLRAVDQAPIRRVTGRVAEVTGSLVEAELPGVALGTLCRVGTDGTAEVVGFRGSRALLQPLEAGSGLAWGDRVRALAVAATAPVGEGLLGRVICAMGRPLDGLGALRVARRRRINGVPPDALKRRPVDRLLKTGVRAIDGLMPLAHGQRMMIASGSGVGKSTLLGMLARFVETDAVVVNLVGERGRELNEFLEDALGKEGRSRSVVVVATSDQSPALQLRSTSLATTIAEDLRDQGKDVLLLVDSLTRLALARRQIGLAAGEPPTTRGFTPSVFSLMPPLLERAGCGEGPGSITGIYTVLVEADDENDPIADWVRGIVDGHIVLSRKLARQGHYPAIDVLSSLSRVADRVTTPDQRANMSRYRALLSTWRENEDLVKLGAYKRGAMPEVDEAIARRVALEAFTCQEPRVRALDIDAALRAATSGPPQALNK